ncbi:hypothetical protein IKO18_00275 [bacterium]|nr:hypothetical protein [bacterium]
MVEYRINTDIEDVLNGPSDLLAMRQADTLLCGRLYSVEEQNALDYLMDIILLGSWLISRLPERFYSIELRSLIPVFVDVAKLDVTGLQLGEVEWKMPSTEDVTIMDESLEDIYDKEEVYQEPYRKAIVKMLAEI